MCLHITYVCVCICTYVCMNRTLNTPIAPTFQPSGPHVTNQRIMHAHTQVLGPKFLNIDRGNRGMKVLALIIYIIGLLILGYIALLRLKKRS